MSHRPARAALLALCATLPMALPAPAPAATKSEDVTVMTRNVYLGADLIPLAAAKTLPEFEQAAAQRFQTVLANKFETRAKPLAAEIVKAKPDVLALQEAAVWKRSPDGVKDGNATKATQVVYDSVKLLQAELKKRGVSYKAVVTRPWFDFEAPTALGYDVRLTQNDVILVRAGKGAKVRVAKTLKGGFKDTFDVPTQAGLARSPRGYVGIDAKKGRKSFRFVTTHLEAYSSDIASKQMKQLLRGPLASKKRAAILVGDFNSAPKGSVSDRGTDRASSAYYDAIDAGFKNPLPKRATCCFAEDLKSTSKPLETWIDHIVVRPNMRAVSSSIVGSKSANRVGGLWPSDHAGIVAKLRMK